MRNPTLALRWTRDLPVESRIYSLVDPTFHELTILISPFCILPFFREGPYLNVNRDVLDLRQEKYWEDVSNLDVDEPTSDLIGDAGDKACYGWLWESIATNLVRANSRIDGGIPPELVFDLFEMYTMGMQINGKGNLLAVRAIRDGPNERFSNFVRYYEFFERFSDDQLKRAYAREIELASRYTFIPPKDRDSLTI